MKKRYLSHCSFAVKRHHHYRHSSDKRKHWIEDCLQFPRFISLSSWQRVLWNSVRQGAGEVTSGFNIRIHMQQKEGATGPGFDFWKIKAHPQWLTYLNKDTPLNSSEVVLLPVDETFKYMCLWGHLLPLLKEGSWSVYYFGWMHLL